MPRYVPPRITDKGLKSHLDFTKNDHNGYGYDDFVKMRNTDPPVNKAVMARLFKVTTPTMKKWIEIYKIEIADE